jgi:ankyrin repeat protein
VRFDGVVADGVTVPGTPVVAVGSNGHLAWGTTAFPTDVLDLVELELDSEHDRYWNGSEWRPFATRVEKILVRGAEPVELEARETEWGPVLKREVSGRNVALNWTVLKEDGVDFRLKDLVRATSVDEGVEICREGGGPPLGVVLADADGRIGWTISGRLPRHLSRGKGLVRPARGERPWSSYLRPDEHPAVVDPPSGRIVTCNNLAPEQEGLGLNGFSAGRAARVAEQLGSAGRSEEAERGLQLDLDASFYDFYRELVLDAAEGDGPSHRRAALAALADWDGLATPDSEALPILVRVRERLLHELFAPLVVPCAEADDDFTYVWRTHEAALRALLGADDLPLPTGYGSRRELVLAVLDRTLEELEETAQAHGRARAVWADLSFRPLRHPLGRLDERVAPVLDPPPEPIAGCPESVCAVAPLMGPSLRLVVSPGRESRGTVSVAGGQGSNAAVGRYRTDYLDWLAGRSRPLTPQEPVESCTLEPVTREGGEEPVSDIFSTIQEGDLETVKKVVEDDPEAPKKRNDDGVSAPMWALYNGKRDVAEYLTPLVERDLDQFEAASLGDLEQIKKWVAEHPEEIDEKSKDGFTPLLLAAYFGQPEIARFLLESGADPTISSANNLHVAPIHAATADDQEEIVDLLLDLKVPLNVTTGEGFTALHNAAQNGNVEMIRKLIEHGADPTQPMYEGKRAADFAHEFGHPEAAEVIEAALATR